MDKSVAIEPLATLLKHVLSYPPFQTIAVNKVNNMNTAEQIYQDVQDFPEALAPEILDFVEFLKFKHQSASNLELEQKIQQGIYQAESNLGVILDNDYADNLNQRVQQRLAAIQKINGSLLSKNNASRA